MEIIRQEFQRVALIPKKLVRPLEGLTPVKNKKIGGVTVDNLTKLIELKAQKKILEQLQANLQAEKEKAKKLLTEARQSRIDLEDVDTRGMSDEEKYWHNAEIELADVRAVRHRATCGGINTALLAIDAELLCIENSIEIYEN